MRAALFLLVGVGGCVIGGTPSVRAAAEADRPFLQEVASPWVAADASVRDARSVAVATDATVWAATTAGVQHLDRGSRQWKAAPSAIGAQPAFVVRALPQARVLAGAWNGCYIGGASGLEPVANVQGPISAITLDTPGRRAFVAGPDGLWGVSLDTPPRAVRRELGSSRAIRGLALTPEDTLWAATGLGLYRQGRDRGAYVIDTTGNRSCDFKSVTAAAFDWSPARVWAGGLGGVCSVDPATGGGAELSPGTGFPSPEIQCLVPGPDGRLWVGTRRGLLRWDGAQGSVRHSRRWMPDDDVRDIAFAPGGDRQAGYEAWIATAGGAASIAAQPMTLAAKAAHYAAVCQARHVRPPGIVEKCRLRTPGDVSTWTPEDDDNDGGYTAVYLAMQAFRYAATRDPEARTLAQRAFAALRLLQTVTETPGFIARTVVPADWKTMHDSNETWSDAEQAARRVEDPRSKYVPVRWRRSRDGCWLWKGDTSSDEITAHMFGYYYYHELAAEGPERSAVRDQVCRIVDHLIEHGYRLVDQDGRATRWGVWAPEQLRNDPDWAPEAGINAVEILSFLKLAGHVSGDPKYADHARRLLRDHDYAALVRRAKNLNPASRTHIDDELLAFAWPPLIALERDPALAALYRSAFEQWHAAVRPDVSPFFEVLYALLTPGAEPPAPVFTDLRDQPLDLIRWTVDNRDRADVRLVRAPELEQVQTERLLPPSERGVPRTDENPRRAVQGDGGSTESDGVFWLLPYWMARHGGFLGGP